MIKSTEMISKLIDAEPPFKAKISNHREKWGKEVLSVQFMEFAYYIVQKISVQDIESLANTFSTIETFFTDGDESTQRLASIGLMEAIQDVSMSGNIPDSVLTKLMGTETLKSWNLLRDTWEKAQS